MDSGIITSNLYKISNFNVLRHNNPTYLRKLRDLLIIHNPSRTLRSSPLCWLHANCFIFALLQTLRHALLTGMICRITSTDLTAPAAAGGGRLAIWGLKILGQKKCFSSFLADRWSGLIYDDFVCRLYPVTHVAERRLTDRL